MAPIKLCVLDDHMVVQDGIRTLAEREPDIELVGAASDGNELLELLESEQPDVLLLDLRLGSESSFELCAAVHRAYPSIRILVFTAFGSVDLLRASLRAGAAGYVLKDVSTRSLPEIIRHAHEKGSYFDPRLASEVILGLFGEDASRKPVLRERELEILRLISLGEGNREIARKLHLSPHTIKFHISKLMKEFGVSRRAELVRVAFDRQLLDATGLGREGPPPSIPAGSIGRAREAEGSAGRAGGGSPGHRPARTRHGRAGVQSPPHWAVQPPSTRSEAPWM